MLMKKIAVYTFLFSLVSASAFAGGYKSAGCGLGSMIITDEGFSQIFAATTNGTAGSQTFGISSGTSNCAGSGGIAKNDVEQKVFVSSNFESLSQEAAQGSGEHLNALAGVLGCGASDVTHFSRMMKSNFKTLDRSSPEKFLENVKSNVRHDSSLAKSCSSIG